MYVFDLHHHLMNVQPGNVILGLEVVAVGGYGLMSWLDRHDDKKNL
jgi:hypothetical protein